MFIVLQPSCMLPGTTKMMNKTIDQGSWRRGRRGPQGGQQCYALRDTGPLFLERFGGEVVSRTPSMPDRRTDLSNRKSPLVHTKGADGMARHMTSSPIKDKPWWRCWNEMLTAFLSQFRLQTPTVRCCGEERGGVARMRAHALKLARTAGVAAVADFSHSSFHCDSVVRGKRPRTWSCAAHTGTKRGGHLVFVPCQCEL